MTSTKRRSPPWIGLCLLLAGCGSAATRPDWVEALGYGPHEVHRLEVGELGYPYVAVDIAGERLDLPFDTGNMVGVSVSSSVFDRIGLKGDGSWTPLASSGAAGASLRVARDVAVSVLGRDIGRVPVYELDSPKLPGLVGPGALDGGHFTMDYAARRMALGRADLPDSPPGFTEVPLVRSGRHPGLILVHGTIAGKPVLLELDTGKSRTVVNPALVAELGLERDRRGVTIESLGIGDRSFEVPSAKEVDQTGIDTGLSEPVLGGIGSDILSRFVWTVDYDAGRLWLERP